MKPASATWKVGLVFAGIFFAGVIAGGFTSVRLQKALVQRGGAPDPLMMHLNRLTDRLKLDDQQKERIGAIIAATSDELRPLRREIDKSFQIMNTKIVSELTIEQKKEFEEMQRRWRERVKVGRPLGGRDDKKGAAPEGALPPLPPPPRN
ncbi:MAG: hypothetical protein JNN01_25235 [Opitutaceae bacterium]|nr:hypothetical protein [Opitutaceae bacterium]